MSGRNSNAHCAGLAARRHPQRLRVCEWTDRIDVYLRACGPGRRQTRRHQRRGSARLRSSAARDAFARRTGRLQRRLSRAPSTSAVSSADGELSERVEAMLGDRTALRADAAARLAPGAARRRRARRGTRARSRGRAAVARGRLMNACCTEFARSILGRIDAWYYRRHRLRTLGPVLYLGQTRYRGPELRFEDGTVLRDNDPIGRLHFNNASIAALGEGSMQRVGFRFAKLDARVAAHAGRSRAFGSRAARRARVPGRHLASGARRSRRLRQHADAAELAHATARATLSNADVGLRARGAHSRTRAAPSRDSTGSLGRR